jgi:hypothetical protein
METQWTPLVGNTLQTKENSSEIRERMPTRGESLLYSMRETCSQVYNSVRRLLMQLANELRSSFAQARCKEACGRQLV